MKKFIFMMVALFATVTMSAQHIAESKVLENTYVSLNVGGTVSVPNIHGLEDVNELRPIIGLELGKDLTTLYGMSIEGKASINNKGIHTAFDDISVVWNHKLNLTNMIWGYKDDRKWELKAVGGLGWGHDNGCVNDNYLVAESGLELGYSLDNKWSLNIRPTYVWDNAEHGLNANNSEIELMVGVTYHFKGKNFKKCNVDEVLVENAVLNDKINELREKEELLKSELETKNNTILVKDKEIAELNAREMTTNVVIPQVIGFEIGKSKILSTNDASLITLAQLLKENDELKVEVVGYADAQTGTKEINQRLSEERAEAVKNALVELGVDESRINTVGKGDTEQLFDKNDANRAVVNIVK